MQDLIKRLEKLKAQKASAHNELVRLQGQRDQLTQQLKDDFECSTLDEAKAKLESLEKDILKRETRAEKLLNELEVVVNG